MPPVVLSDGSGALALAVAVSADVGDPVQRIDLLAAIAAGFRDAGNIPDSATVATDGARRVENVPPSGDAAVLKLRLAEILLEVGETDLARRLITEATVFAASVRDEKLQSTLLPAIVSSAITGGDQTRDLLPAAVDPVYVIEDPELRAETFIAIARTYQAVGEGQSVVGLIQQAIPAIRSVADPMVRARLFADLAHTAMATGASDLATELVHNAEQELKRGTLEKAPSPETTAAVARALADERGGTAAIIVNAAVAEPAARSAGLVAIADTVGTDPTAVLALNRAFEVTQPIQDAEIYSALMVSIAYGYARNAMRDRAFEAAELAGNRMLSGGAAIPNAALVDRWAALYAILDRTDSMSGWLNFLDDAYLRARASVAVANALIDEGRQGVADDFLVDALLEADRADYLSDSVRLQIARGFSRSGNYSLAIRTIERITDPELRAQAVVALGVVAEPLGGLSAVQRADLEAVLGL